jgi:hypothetical protein
MGRNLSGKKSLLERLVEPPYFGGKLSLKPELVGLLEAGGTARSEIAAAIIEQDRLDELMALRAARLREGELLGRDVAAAYAWTPDDRSLFWNDPAI